MVLFLSDIHFGEGAFDLEREKEDDLIACLRSLEADVEGLYLLGDVFDQYIEYRHLVPKGFVRFQALLAEWTDRGIPVAYLVGNHDPWHRDYFERELGVRVHLDRLVEPLYGIDVHMAHGDGVAPDRLYNRLKPWLRHPVPVWLYRTLLPGDVGYRLARWARSAVGGELVEPETVDALRDHAHRLLAATSAELVVLGHSHRAELCVWPEGRYLNAGCWSRERTFGCLDRENLELRRWNGTLSAVLEAVTVETPAG